MGWIWVLSILTILCGSVWFDVFLLLLSIFSAWGFFWCAKLSSNFTFLFVFVFMKRWGKREGVNRGGEKRLVGAKVILHILCSSSWKVHDTQEQLSLSLSALFPFIHSSFLLPSFLPSFLQQTSQWNPITFPLLKRQVNRLDLISHGVDCWPFTWILFLFEATSETLEIPVFMCHFSSLMDNLHLGRILNWSEIRGLNLSFFSSIIWFNLHGNAGVSRLDRLFLH